jgi:hypothetical protein
MILMYGYSYKERLETVGEEALHQQQISQREGELPTDARQAVDRKSDTANT